MSRPHHILYLSSAGLTPCEIGRNLIRTGATLPPGAEGLARFDSLLQAWPPGRHVTILADLADEAHHLEALPFIRGKDRRNMLDRRRLHLFGDTPFTLAHSLGRSPEGRRDEHILFAALPHPEVLTPWLERLAHAGHALKGIVSVPFVTRHCLPEDASRTAPVLLAHATPAGFRVSCFERGHPRFSRLTPLVPVTAAADRPTTSWQEELRRSTDYLLNQRILPRNTPTPVVLIHSSALDCLPDADLSTLHPDLAVRMEVPAAKAPSGEEASLHGLLEILSRHRAQPQFAPQSMRARYNRVGVAQGVRILAAAICVVCAGVALHDLGTIRDLQQQREADLPRIRALEAQAHTLRAGLHTPPQHQTELTADLAALEAWMHTRQGPEADLRHLADILSNHPAIHIEALEWRNTPQFGDAPAGIQADRSLDISIARSAYETPEDVHPPHLMNLLRALRQWPEAEVRHTRGSRAPQQPDQQGVGITSGDKAATDFPSIQIQWRHPR